MNETVFDILRMEAREKYYINESKIPAIIICDSIGVMDKKYTLYFADIKHWNFKTWKACKNKLNKILDSAKIPVKVYKQKRGNNKKIRVR